MPAAAITGDVQMTDTGMCLRYPHLQLMFGFSFLDGGARSFLDVFWSAYSALYCSQTCDTSRGPPVHLLFPQGDGGVAQPRTVGASAVSPKQTYFLQTGW